MKTDAQKIEGALSAIAFVLILILGVLAGMLLGVAGHLDRIADALERAHPPAATETDDK